MEAPHCTASSKNSSSAAGNRVSYLKTYARQSSLPCIRTKEKNLTAATTGGSPFSPSPAKFSLDFYSTGLFHPSPKNTSQKVSVKCHEQNMGLYATFVDLTKVFDTVSRKGLWQILEPLGCPRRFLNMVIQLHEDQRGQIRLEGDLSEPFPISNGVKQGCVLAPTLFSIFFSMMLKQVNEDLEDEDGVYVRYRLDGSLFNLRRLQAHTKTH